MKIFRNQLVSIKALVRNSMTEISILKKAIFQISSDSTKLSFISQYTYISEAINNIEN